MATLNMTATIKRTTQTSRMVNALIRGRTEDNRQHLLSDRMLGLLMAQYTFTGYDASAHMSEETHNADLAAPRGIVTSIVVSLVADSSWSCTHAASAS